MQDGVLTPEVLASLGLDLTRYNELVGEIYDGALDPKLMATAPIWRGFLMLEVADLQTSYGRSQVLFGVALEIGRSEVVSLLGRNGMGKTTTVKSVVGHGSD